jgi:hypothetical protein
MYYVQKHKSFEIQIYKNQISHHVQLEKQAQKVRDKFSNHFHIKISCTFEKK